jgi:methyl-accepting chemotaxis protein
VQRAVEVMEAGQQQTKLGVEHTEDAGDALKAIAEAVTTIKGLNNQIVASTEEQSQVATTIDQNLANINQLAEQTTNGVEQTAAVGQELKRIALGLQEQVGRFRLSS